MTGAKYRNKITGMIVTLVERNGNRVLVRDETGNRGYFDTADFDATYTLNRKGTA
jgi:hypothetical protein